MLETLDWYQISWNLVLPIHVMDQVEVVHVKIESILWSHHKLKIIPHIQPTALSISQGRAVGLIHYTRRYWLYMGIYYFKDTCLDFLTYFLPSEASKGVYPPCAGLLFGLSDWI